MIPDEKKKFLDTQSYLMHVFCSFDDCELQIKNDYESDLRGNENYLSSGENTGFKSRTSACDTGAVLYQLS